MMNHVNVRAAAIECGQILANFAGDGNNAPRNTGIEVLFERADSRLENVILRGEPLFEALARVEPASGADMGSDDVRPQTAQPLRVNNIESPGNRSCCGQKSQNRGKRRESPCRNMVKVNRRVLTCRQRVCEYVNLVLTPKTFRQFDHVPTMTTGSMIIVNDKRDLHFGVAVSSNILVSSRMWFSMVKRCATVMAPLRKSE